VITLLDRHLGRHLAAASGLVLAALLALFSFVTLTEELDEVGTGSYSATDAISVTLLTLPARALDLLPVSALLGALLGLGALANQRELLALRAAGVSPWRLARTLCAWAALASLLALALQSWLVPAAERRAQEFRSRQLAQTAIGGSEFWSRHERVFLRVGAVDFGRIPRDIEIYELGRRGELARVLRADRADVISAREWRLQGVEDKLLERDQVRVRISDSESWHSFLTPAQFATLIAPAHALSPYDLASYIRAMRGSGVDTRTYQVLLWRQLALPVALFAMTLLALPFVVGNPRARSAGLRVLVGGTLGIGFYLAEQIANQLAQILDLPPAPLALLPASLLLAGALYALRRSAGRYSAPGRA